MTTAPHPTHPDHPQEAAHLQGTIQAMLERINAWEDRDRNVGADLETSVTMADVAEEHAAVLSPHVHAPYFGSLRVRVGGKTHTLYIGKHAFRDLKGPHSVTSWESDVGSLFYSEALRWTPKRGPEGTILRRRQLDVRDKTLRAVVDLYDVDAGGDTGGREEVLLRRLAEGSTTGMRDVVETLQPEQNDAMRAPAGTHTLIQGAAGSGKTTIGFHRLAWMSHPDRGVHMARPEACMVLMPNAVLASYAARVLPGLQLEGVTVTTPETWAVGFLGLEKLEITDRTLTLLLTDRDNTRRAAAWRKAKLLGDLRMLQVVRQHLHGKFRAGLAGADLRLNVEVRRAPLTLTLDHATLSGLLEDVLARDPLEGYRHAYRAALEAEVLARANASDAEEAGVLRQVAQDLTRLLGRVFGNVLPVSEARRLLTDEAALRAAADGILKDRMIDVLLSDPLTAVPRPRRANADVTELPLMLAVQALMGGLGRVVGRTLEPYDHLVLDEAQDYSPLLYTLLGRATRPGHLTALGDLNQGLHGYKGPSQWADVQAALGGGTQLTLTRTYRSTRQITALAAQVAATYNRAGAVVGVDRDGPEVLRLTGGGVPHLAAQAVKAMQAAGHTNIALVTRRTADADALVPQLQAHDVDSQPITNEQARYRGGVVILPVNLAKGLEFDGCVVVGADADNYDPDTEYENRLLYVSASRGLHMLALVAQRDLHPLLG
ncbi:HelD family protein [Deinococcus maricopensis]|uniref:Putative UvrD/rep helicase family protein n=1 Tax=Deinococcus maricopensis (strain DSM 21211 / LMG 22137 / NRRL B-23946 / LB-34) TaxID=709986 RepID=E8U4R4_DEIML|nr:ATP-binding domain-containing protein [Deinococcus maricopensis]ADV66053.1 putative UvrD/rep helicase family protein [Deinococcus maricopensis DSM 21211]